jgi:dGTPase
MPENVSLTYRSHPREEDIRGPYFRDQTAIIHCTSFRRLKHKTQAFFAPDNDHICTRIEHVLHVATVASTICRGLSRAGWDMNDELAYAAGLGHDLGHAPFGHSGERMLTQLIAPQIPRGFRHEVHSLRVVEHLERNGDGLNLTYGVRDAILCHDGETFEQYLTPGPVMPLMEKLDIRRPSSQEGCAVRFADKIAYLGRDLEDALRMPLIKRKEVPEEVGRYLGTTNGTIINSLVIDLIENSLRQGKIGFSDGAFEILCKLKDFNYERIYRHPRILQYEKYCRVMVRTLYEHFMENLAVHGRDCDRLAAEPLQLDQAFGHYLRRMEAFYTREGSNDMVLCVDFVAGMTDNYAQKCYEQLVLPEPLAFPPS